MKTQISKDRVISHLIRLVERTERTSKGTRELLNKFSKELIGYSELSSRTAGENYKTVVADDGDDIMHTLTYVVLDVEDDLHHMKSIIHKLIEATSS